MLSRPVLLQELQVGTVCGVLGLEKKTSKRRREGEEGNERNGWREGGRGREREREREREKERERSVQNNRTNCLNLLITEYPSLLPLLTVVCVSWTVLIFFLVLSLRAVLSLFSLPSSTATREDHRRGKSTKLCVLTLGTV